MSDAQPIRDTIALDGDGSCIAEARHRAVDFLARVQAEYGLPVSARAMDLTQLVVSELVTNARKYAPGPVLMELRIVGTWWKWSCGTAIRSSRWPGPPTRAEVGQHGLEIVMAVAQSYEVHREPVGKRITARIVLPDDPGGDITGRPPSSSQRFPCPHRPFLAGLP